MSDKEKSSGKMITTNGNSNVRDGAQTPVYRKPTTPPPPKSKPEKTK